MLGRAEVRWPEQMKKSLSCSSSERASNVIYSATKNLLHVLCIIFRKDVILCKQKSGLQLYFASMAENIAFITKTIY